MSDLADEIQMLKKAGKTLKEIEKLVGLSHGFLIGYLPYSKTIYSMKEISVDAERIKRFKKRHRLYNNFAAFVAGEKSLSDVSNALSEEEYLWSTLVSLSGCIFRTSGRGSRLGVKFKYVIKDEASGEMKIDWEEKTITKAIVFMAYRNVKGKKISGPKAIGAPGTENYLYPMFLGQNERG